MIPCPHIVENPSLWINKTAFVFFFFEEKRILEKHRIERNDKITRNQYQSFYLKVSSQSLHTYHNALLVQTLTFFEYDQHFSLHNLFSQLLIFLQSICLFHKLIVWNLNFFLFFSIRGIIVMITFLIEIIQ